MELRVSFDGGPLHRQTALTDGLDEFKIFFPPNERQILAYRRMNETTYVYSQHISEELTKRYDKAKARFASQSTSTIRFEDETGPIEPVDPLDFGDSDESE
jgi:hypothetical protein